MFRVYKPKNFIKVRALQVTKENVQDVAGLLLGRVALSEEPVPRGTAPEAVGIDVPTFDGPLRFEIGTWIIRAEDNSLSKMTAAEFDKTYEVARNMSNSAGVQIGHGNIQANHF